MHRTKPPAVQCRCHLGSTSLAANGTTGAWHSEQRYKPWGETRYTNGTTPTRRQYTGQINDSEIGLYFYNARYYSSASGRFVSADTIVPDGRNPQAFNRYSYVNNRPLNFTDPSGHYACDDDPCSPPPTLQRTLRSLQPSRRFVQPMGKMTPSGFSYGDFHPGKDYSGAGNPPIRASANGVVIAADACSRADCIGLYQQVGAFDPNVNKGYGNVMIIEYPYNSLPAVVQGDIGLSEGESLYMLYAHLQNAPTLYAGDTVRPGQIVGNAGNSGNSGGSHLHHETRIGKTGSLSLGDICTDTSCARFYTWYKTGQFRSFDPATLYYYTARELRMMQP